MHVNVIKERNTATFFYHKTQDINSSGQHHDLLCSADKIFNISNKSFICMPNFSLKPREVIQTTCIAMLRTDIHTTIKNDLNDRQSHKYSKYRYIETLHKCIMTKEAIEIKQNVFLL